jgi:hypothetical protein
MTMKDIPCPRCGNLMFRETVGSHYYYYCLEMFGGKGGCNTIYADDKDCYFNDIYIITPQGELRGYKSWKGGEFIKTKKFLPDVWGRHAE